MLQQYSIVNGRIAHSSEGSTPVDVYVLPTDEHTHPLRWMCMFFPQMKNARI